MPKQLLRKTHKICLLLVGSFCILNPAPATGTQFRVENDFIVIDQSARRIVVQKPFKRIISLYGAHTENLYSLGLGEEIIGVSRHEDYPPQALKKPVFSYHDDPEKFLVARPDLVLVRPMIDRGYPNLISRLEKSGISVVSLQPGTITDMYVYWKILGVLTGRHNQASAMVTHFRRAVSEFNALTKSLPEKKRVYFEAIHSKMKTFSPDSMAIFALETAGGINVAAGAKPVRKTNIAFFGKERILSHGPQIDVYLAQYGAMNRPTVPLIKNEPGYQTIKAVSNNEIYIVDERIVSRPTFRLLNGIVKIGTILYPDVFDNNSTPILDDAKKF
jgi:iron complex transport system substrate-binding protein